MRPVALISALSLTLALSAPLVAGADPTVDPSTIGTVQTMTVSPQDLTALGGATRHYFDSVLNNETAFFAATTPNYQAVSLDGKMHSSGDVYGYVQGRKLELSGITTRVSVIDAHHLGATFDETAVFSGVADTFDSSGAHAISHTWVHKITFVRDASGNFIVARDQVLAMM